jgi:dihydrolipoamide dehydrogenase
MHMQHVDAIIIGSGQGGVPLAVALAEQGKQVVLFERSNVGGSCVNFGCTPSKSFLASAHAAGRARQAASVGVHAQVEIDFPMIMQRVDRIRTASRHSNEKRLNHPNIQLVRAEASFVGERQVTDGGDTWEAPFVLIDTGSRAVVPDLPGLADTPYLTDHNFWEIKELPRRILILGAGYIGLETGQGLARLGSEVHIVDRSERPLDREEADVSDTLRDALEEDGVQFHMQSKVEHVHFANNMFTLSLEGGEQISGDMLLVATGRQPNTEPLNVNASGIELDDKGYVQVNDQLQTTCSGVYAIGDVAKQPPFTHVSWEDYRRLLAILNGEKRTRDDLPVCYAVFTEPQVGRVGLTEDEAKQKGHTARSVTMPLSSTSRGSEWDAARGFYRIVVDDNTDKILGATFVGYEAAETVHTVVAHITVGSTWQTLARSMHIHPTFAETLPSLALMLED